MINQDVVNNRILMDVDDVLLDLIGEWLLHTRMLFDVDIHPDQIISWDIATHSGLGDRIFEVLEIDGFYSLPDPIQGSLKSVRAFMDLGFEVILVTAIRHGIEDRRRWLKKHMPWFPVENLVIVQRKELIPALMMFDDRFENLQTASVQFKFLITAPWNRHIDAEAHGMTRLDKLSDFFEASDEIKEQRLYLDQRNSYINMLKAHQLNQSQMMSHRLMAEPTNFNILNLFS